MRWVRTLAAALTGFAVFAVVPIAGADDTTSSSSTPASTEAPETSSPETTAPESTVPETTAPETTTPSATTTSTTTTLVAWPGTDNNTPTPASRGSEPVQVSPTDPPPPTTTTLPPNPFPYPVPANSGSGRRAVFSKSQFRVWIIEQGSDGVERVIRTYRVTARRDTPPNGTHYVYSRSRYTYASGNPDVKMEKMVRFYRTPRYDNIGFHQIPTHTINWKTGARAPLQTEAQLGMNGLYSGGCIRQSAADADFMWNWAQVGTKVVVVNW